jgi:glutathionyl-hydroquinone reductase
MHADSLANLIARFDAAANTDDRRWLRHFEHELLQVARSAGLTDDPAVYATHFARFFSALDTLDAELDQRRYLLGGATPTAADRSLALLLGLYDGVFYPLYKLNRQRLDEFANLAHYLRDVFSERTFRASVDCAALKREFFLESRMLNPKQRVPLGSVDLDAAHDRAIRFSQGSDASAVEEDQSKHPRHAEWRRKSSGHRHSISADGSSGYAAEPQRYHLYIANNCPWCHRTAIARNIKRLEEIVTMDVLFYRRDPERGWRRRPHPRARLRRHRGSPARMQHPHRRWA